MKSHLLKVLGFAATVLELVLVVLVVDAICWIVPFLLRNYGASEIQSKCAEVKVGMSPDQAIRVMHKGFTPSEEWEGRPRFAPADELHFWSPSGTCIAQVDKTTGSIVRVQFDDRWGPIQ